MTGIEDESFELLGVYKLESVEKAIFHFFSYCCHDLFSRPTALYSIKRNLRKRKFLVDIVGAMYWVNNQPIP
jgi:hypothetical protein